MKKYFFTLMFLSVSILTVSACTMNDPADMPPGKYERTTTSTDANGTEYKTQKSTDVTVDEDGDKKAVVKSKSTQDPKGLFNKKTTSSESTYEEDR